MFDPVDPKQSLPDIELGILQYWKEEDIFKRSMHQRQRKSDDLLDSPGSEKLKMKSKKDTEFSFYDGPPFATGLPHYGHLLAGTIKDVIPRYQTMRGKYVQRRFGWDCHGLPIENIVEQEHNIESKQEIEEKGVKWFNDLCREAVQRYTKDWRTVVERMGRWVDMDWDYRTMDPEYMESMWWAFSELHKKGLLYEGHKPMHVCPRCVTPLSNFEVTQGYKDITDQSVVAKFELADEPGTFVLAWTTTPWTLPGNLLLAVGKKIVYQKVSFEGSLYILAKDLVENVFNDKEYEIKDELKGKDLIGKSYNPLFPYFIDEYKDHDAFVIVDGDFVTTKDGTGVVHIAPGFGEDDFQAGEKQKLPLLQHVTLEGQFIPTVTDFSGLSVKPKDDPTKTDKKIIEWLKEKNLMFDSKSYRHSYPHCWRCDSPLLNYATSSWFVAVEKLKTKMLANKDKTEWVPSHIKDGRYGKWLEGARDWALSRNRYWGTPLPIWRCQATDEIDVISSRDDLMQHALNRFTKITAVRHGESEGNLVPVYQGKLPGTDLTKNGMEQAKTTGAQLANGPTKVDIIYCSPLARTQQTAAAIAKETGAEVRVDERLREVEFGEYEEKTIDFTDLAFIKAKRAHKLEKNTPESIYHFPGMETWNDVNARISDFMNDVLPKHRGQHIVIVTHADPVQNLKHFFRKEDPVKISHQPYPKYAEAHAFFWDHNNEAQMDLHKENVDDITWFGGSSENDVALTLMRHGEALSNAENKENGWSDDPLTDKGREQALKQAKLLKGQTFDAVICSDLPRAKETAEIITKELGIEITDKWEELRERNTGEWQGMLQEEILKQNPPVNPEYKTTSFHHASPKGGETLSEFLERANTAIEKFLETYKGKKVLVVTHGGMIRALRTQVENLSFIEAVALYPKNAEAYSLTLSCPYRRIPEVLDCWFESGSMPYAQGHYPFDCNLPSSESSKDRGVTMHSDIRPLPAGFPANFIAEGVDQTRAWFYTLMVLSTALFDDTPFMNVVVNGTVLAEDGKKMSKRLKNYPDPMVIVEKYGADAIRFALMSSPAVRAEDLRMSERLVEETLRGVLLPLWNTYSFFVTYANSCQFEPVENRRASAHPLDMWIRAEVQDLVNRMTAQLDRYDLSATCAELDETIDALTNWYIRLSRRRFAGKTETGAEEDQLDALHTLYDVLLTISQTLAPFCPYITDAIYLNLVPEDHGSIHLTDWPETRDLSDEEQLLLTKTRLQRTIVSLGLSIRGEQNIKVRQPLASATIAIPPALAERIQLSHEEQEIIRQELNVKELTFTEDPGSLAQAIAQVDARKVGPRMGKRVQEIIAAGKNGEFTIKDDGAILILDELLTADEVQIVYRGKEGQNAAADKGVVVSVETDISDALLLEGHARDIIRAVQRLRKESGLEFTDHIALHITGADDILAAHGDMITQETSSSFAENKGEEHEVEIGEKKVKIRFEKE